jgi:hypothetical protein
MSNEHLTQAAELMRVALLDGLQTQEKGISMLQHIVRALIRKARGGNMQAIREVMNRTLGKPLPGITRTAADEPRRVVWLDHPLLYPTDPEINSGTSTDGASDSPAS